MDEELRKFALSLTVDLHKAWLKKGDINCMIEQQIDDMEYIASRFYSFLKEGRK